jgi:triphosphatase
MDWPMIEGISRGSPTPAGDAEPWRAIVAARLELAPAAPAEPGSPPALVRADEAAPEAQRIRRRQTVPSAAAALAGRHCRAFERAEIDVRRTASADAVHDARVALRRLRASARLFEPYWRADRYGAAQDHLRRTDRRLSFVRDLDVAMGEIAAMRPEIPADAHTGLDAILRRLAARRARCMRAAQAHLRGRKRLRAWSRWSAALSSVSGVHGADPTQPRLLAGATLGTLAPGLFFAALRRVRRRHRAIDETAGAAAWHELRIAARRLRYLCEDLRELHPRRLRAFIRPLKVLQDALGALQDTVTVRGMVCADLEGGMPGVRARAAAQRVLEILAGRAPALEAKARDAWRAFDRRATIMKLLRAAARV